MMRCYAAVLMDVHHDVAVPRIVVAGRGMLDTVVPHSAQVYLYNTELGITDQLVSNQYMPPVCLHMCHPIHRCFMFL